MLFTYKDAPEVEPVRLKDLKLGDKFILNGVKYKQGVFLPREKADDPPPTDYEVHLVNNPHVVRRMHGMSWVTPVPKPAPKPVEEEKLRWDLIEWPLFDGWQDNIAHALAGPYYNQLFHDMRSILHAYDPEVSPERCLAQALTYGASKHSPEGWKEQPISHHLAAFCRHYYDGHMAGNVMDEDSGLPHLALAYARAMMLAYLKED